MRLLFLVDVQNLFYSARDIYGADARIDFGVLKAEAICGRAFTTIRCIAYLTHFKDRDDIESLKRALSTLAYETRISLIKKTDDGLAGTDVDVELATDAIAKSDEYDVIVVGSGDSDLIPAYRVLKEKGKRVEVLAFAESASKSIMDIVDEVRFLGKGVLYVPPASKSQKEISG